MERVTFAEYENAKAEIIKGVCYRESSTLEGNVIHKTYATEENGCFYEVDNAGRIHCPCTKFFPSLSAKRN